MAYVGYLASIKKKIIPKKIFSDNSQKLLQIVIIHKMNYY